MKRRSERHGVDDEVAVVGECEDDHFEEHVHDNQRMLDGMDQLVGSDAVPTR